MDGEDFEETTGQRRPSLEPEEAAEYLMNINLSLEGRHGGKYRIGDCVCFLLLLSFAFPFLHCVCSRAS